jgi:hypothetical protein
MAQKMNVDTSLRKLRLLRILSVGIAVLASQLDGVLNFALARNIYVNSANGDDAFDGILPDTSVPGSGPLRTINRAMLACAAGDHIVVANSGKPYRETVTLAGSRRSGTDYQPFTLEGNGAVLDGSRPVPVNAWKFAANDTFRFQPGPKQYQQLFLDGVPLQRHPVQPGTSGMPALEPKEWALADGWIYFRVEPGLLPQNYALSYACLQTGITLFKVEDVVISGFIVQGYAIDGINCHDAAGRTTLVDCTCRGNGRSGIAVVGTSTVNLQSCLIGDNGQYQLLLQDYGVCNLRATDVLGNTAPKWMVRNGAKLLIDGKPAERDQ